MSTNEQPGIKPPHALDLWVADAWLRARDRAIGIVFASAGQPKGAQVATDGRGTFYVVANGKVIGGCRPVDGNPPGFETWVGEAAPEVSR